MTVAVCDFYRAKRILVTGLTGFKGIWLGMWLLHLGADVMGLALPPEEDALGRWPLLDRHLRWVCGDIGDYSIVARAVAQYQPEMIFHLAAQPLVRRSYREPIATFATNVMGTVHVLEAARQTPTVQAVLVVTSDKCYENREWAWGYRECDAFGGHDPYSASKGCAEIVTAAYQRSFCADSGALQIASARAGNVIGGGDWAADRLVPDLVRGILAGRPIVLRCPQSTRPWQHVLEPLSGYLLLGERLVVEGSRFASGWNFGPVDTDSLTVQELARQVVKLWGRGEIIVDAESTGPHEARYLRLDSSKAVTELGWRPLLSPTERVGRTLEWYMAWQQDPESVWERTRRQIELYEQRLATCPPMAAGWLGASRAALLLDAPEQLASVNLEGCDQPS
jgi:CDP-glucose 4,6-dehydratase